MSLERDTTEIVNPNIGRLRVQEVAERIYQKTGLKTTRKERRQLEKGEDPSHISNTPTPTPSPTSTPTSTSAPTLPSTFCRHRTRRKLRVSYINADRPDLTTHAALETCKHSHVVWIGEPQNGQSWGTTNHPAWRRVTPIDRNTKFTGFLNIRHSKLTKGPIRRSGTVGTITLALTRVVGVYLPSKATIQNVEEDIAIIPRVGSVVI